jgi:hypothetical protein
MGTPTAFILDDEQPDYTVLAIQGVLDENTEMPDFKFSKARDLMIDLNGLRAMNSVGVRRWIQWIHKFGREEIYFRRCPRVFIDQLNNVSDLIPKKSIIFSFYVTYFSERLEEEKNTLYVRGTHYEKGSLLTAPEVLDADGQEMEIDVMPEKYFRFLTKYDR